MKSKSYEQILKEYRDGIKKDYLYFTDKFQEANLSIQKSKSHDEKNILDEEVKNKILDPSKNIKLNKNLKKITANLKNFLKTVPPQHQIAHLEDEERFLKELQGYESLVKNQHTDSTIQTLQGRNHHYERHLAGALCNPTQYKISSFNTILY